MSTTKRATYGMSDREKKNWLLDRRQGQWNYDNSLGHNATMLNYGATAAALGFTPEDMTDGATGAHYLGTSDKILMEAGYNYGTTFQTTYGPKYTW